MFKKTLTFSLALSLVFVIVPASLAQDEAAESVGESAEIRETGILPTNPFYFLKEWGRGIRRAVTFDPVRRAEVELEIADEKAAELRQVSELDGDDEDAVDRAARNYQEAMEELKIRLERISENTDNPRVDQLVDSLTDRVADHQGVIDNLQDRFNSFEELRERFESVRDRVSDTLGPVADRVGGVEQLRERIEGITGDDGEAVRQRLLRALERAGVRDEGGSSDEVGERPGKSDLQERLNELKRGVTDNATSAVERFRNLRLDFHGADEAAETFEERLRLQNESFKQKAEERFRTDTQEFRRRFEIRHRDGADDDLESDEE